MTVLNTAFIDIEESLAKGMHNAWMREQGTQVMREIRRAIEQDDFDEAYRLVDTLDFGPTVRRRLGVIQTQATAAYLLGQTLWTNGELDSTLLGSGDEILPAEVDLSAQALAQDWQFHGTAQARIQARKLIDASQALAGEQKGRGLSNAGMIQKAIIPGLDTALNKAVAGGTQVAFAQGANVATSRLASLGALKQAIAQGATRFQRTAIMDNATCPVCRALHGQTFSITTQVDSLLNLLRVSDPKELKGAAPFPKQNKAALEKMAFMSKEQIVDRGWDLPPSHPLCRCVLVPVGTVPFSQVTGPAGLKLPGVRLDTVFAETAAEGAELAAEANAIGNLQNIVKNNADTDALFKMKNGQYTKGRKVLHQDIVDDFMEGAIAQKKPVFHMMGGGPASGKSSVINGGQVKLPRNHALIDPDSIKVKLPEYNPLVKVSNPKAAAFVHEESSFISKQILRAGGDARANVVLDGTGDGGFAKLRKKVSVLKDEGYTIKADYVTIPTDTAVSRSASRALETGRTVPESVIRETHASVSRDFKRAVDGGLFDEVRLWDNTGAKPVLVFEMKGGKQTVHNQGLWKQFLDKGKE